MTSTALAHYTVYSIAVLFPIESPHFSLALAQLAPLSGGFSTALIEAIEKYGRVRGAAFPSAHVAGSMVAILCAWRYRRWLFWATLPFFVSMMVATIYGRYHYVADVLAGMLVGAGGYVVGLKLMQQAGAVPVDVVAATTEYLQDYDPATSRWSLSKGSTSCVHASSDPSAGLPSADLPRMVL
jgi:membrane-associated phospholipid phosphatase